MATVGWVGNPVLVSVTTTDQKIIVHAEAGFGTNSPTGASQLNLWICWKPTTGTALYAATPMRGLSRSTPGRDAYALTGFLNNHLIGQFYVGLCATSTSPNNWNDNGDAAVTALVLR